MSALATTTKASALTVMASRFSVDPAKLLDTLKNTVFKGANEQQLMALVVVANEYQLNPFTKQIYAFPDKGGGIVPVVGVDGWIAMMNRQPEFDGIDFEMREEAGKPHSCTAIIFLKSRTRPVKVTEYVSECARNTDPWNKSPRRMIRHRALVQAARVAFGFSGIVDEDDAELMGARPVAGHVVEEVQPPKPAHKALHQAAPEQAFSGSTTAETPAETGRNPDSAGEESSPVAETERATPHQGLRNLLTASAVSEASVLAFFSNNGVQAESIDDVPEMNVTHLISKWAEMLPLIKGQQLSDPAALRAKLAELVDADNVTEVMLMKWIKAKKQSDAPSLKNVAPHKIAYFVERWDAIKAEILK